jgi:hypothetical protein
MDQENHLDKPRFNGRKEELLIRVANHLLAIEALQKAEELICLHLAKKNDSVQWEGVARGRGLKRWITCCSRRLLICKYTFVL